MQHKSIEFPTVTASTFLAKSNISIQITPTPWQSSSVRASILNAVDTLILTLLSITVI